MKNMKNYTIKYLVMYKQALGSAEITSKIEPKGTSIQDRKRPDAISYFPFKKGRCLAWDYTRTS